MNAPPPSPASVRSLLLYEQLEYPPHIAKYQRDFIMAYSWPPRQPKPTPPKLSLTRPSILQFKLFECKCSTSDNLYPMIVRDEVANTTKVKAVIFVQSETEAVDALNRPACVCRNHTVYEKVVILPLGENLLYYQVLENEEYTPEQPNTCFLLLKELPERLEVDNYIRGVKIGERKGGCLYEQ